ncbi:MAG: hypothetical protein ACI9OD_004860 [Limisphaerales bacterium]|jgi:hypothetical protein
MPGRDVVAASVSEWILRARNHRTHPEAKPATESDWGLNIAASLKFGFRNLRLPT